MKTEIKAVFKQVPSKFKKRVETTDLRSRPILKKFTSTSTCVVKHDKCVVCYEKNSLKAKDLALMFCSYRGHTFCLDFNNSEKRLVSARK